MKKADRTHTYIFGTLMFGSIILFGVLMAHRYDVFADDLGFSRTSSLLLSHVPEDAKVFIDNNREYVDEGGAVEKSVTPGRHTVLVAKDGFWPWSKEIDLKRRESVTLAPFLLPRESRVEVIERGSSEYERGVAAVHATKLPSQKAPLLSSNGSVAIWVENNQLLARWSGGTPVPAQFCQNGATDCEASLPVYLPTSEHEIIGVQFLPNRDDVILIAINDGIYGIETDTRSTKNFQPLYKGARPGFTVTPDGSVYILEAIGDSERLLHITL